MFFLLGASDIARHLAYHQRLTVVISKKSPSKLTWAFLFQCLLPVFGAVNLLFSNVVAPTFFRFIKQLIRGF